MLKSKHVKKIMKYILEIVKTYSNIDICKKNNDANNQIKRCGGMIPRPGC